MSITMQGAWTVQVKSKSAAFAQRFVIKGSVASDGTYPGETTTPPVFVTGSQWSITIEHQPTGSTQWKRSAERVGKPVRSAGQVCVDIVSNDTGGDVDYNDLILTCSMPESDSEFVIYGKLRSYAGLCGFNPCWPFPVLVIDTMAQLQEMLRYERVAAAIKDLYPERVKPFLARKVVRRPFPEPDPPPFRPMMIPLGEAAETGEALAAHYVEDAPAAREGASARMVTALAQPRATVASAALRDYARLKDKLKPLCTVEDRPGMLLRFLEYDRTADELIGGPYTGEGDRQLLGHTVTDELGNYVFRFTRTLPEIAEEVADVAAGEALAQALRPDIIVQVVSGTSAGVKPLFETALYSDIPNLKRINLCVPASALNPGPTACQGGRAIQAIGNIFTLSGVGNTLYASGRITATHPSGPKITRGAWAWTLDMFACFLDVPDVAFYTIRFRKPGGTWAFVQEQYFHIYIPAIGFPSSLLHKVGPFNTRLLVDGVDSVVPAYKNIENDPDWVATHRLRKVQLSSALYAGVLYSAGAGSVDFRIEGYTAPSPDAAGNKVPGAQDTIRLYIDNRAIEANIDSVSLGVVSPGECAEFELPAPGSALTVRFKVRHPGGFLQHYHLTAMRGSATGVSLEEVTLPDPQPLSLDYSEAKHGAYFYGTANAVLPDVDDYVLAVVEPADGQWLPAGKDSCCFAFTLHGRRRITDGYNLDPDHWLDTELIGLSYTAPSPAP